MVLRKRGTPELIYADEASRRKDQMGNR